MSFLQVSHLQSRDRMWGRNFFKPSIASIWSSGLVTNSFFSVSFLRKIIDLPGGHVGWPLFWEVLFYSFFPATPSSPSQTLDSLRVLLLKLQRYKDTVRRGSQDTCKNSWCTNPLIVRLLKTHFLPLVPDFDRIELSQWPDLLVMELLGSRLQVPEFDGKSTAGFTAQMCLK